MVQSTSKTNQHLQKVADELQHFLADTYILYLKTQNFHWNVKGSNFYSYHKMFEGQYTELAESIDEIAERVRAIGCYVPGSFAQFSQLASLKEERTQLSAKDMLKSLAEDHEVMADHAMQVMAKAQKAKDEATADLMIQRIQVHEKTAWMLRSSLG